MSGRAGGAWERETRALSRRSRGSCTWSRRQLLCHGRTPATAGPSEPTVRLDGRAADDRAAGRHRRASDRASAGRSRIVAPPRHCEGRELTVELAAGPSAGGGGVVGPGAGGLRGRRRRATRGHGRRTDGASLVRGPGSTARRVRRRRSGPSCRSAGSRAARADGQRRHPPRRSRGQAHRRGHGFLGDTP